MFLAASLALSLVSQAPPASLRLPEALARAAQRAPEVAVARASRSLSAAAVGVAGAFDDPSVGIMAEDLGPMDPMLTYRLSVPLGAVFRRGPEKRAASALLDVADARLRRVAVDAQARALDSYLELWMLGAMDELLARQSALLERMKQAATAQYSAGAMMGHHDVLRSETELEVTAARRSAIEDERIGMWHELATIIGLDPGSAIPVLEPPEPLTLPKEVSVEPSVEATPELREMMAMTREAGAQVDRSRAMFWPMPMVGAFYQQRLGAEHDTFGLELELSVPLWWFDRQGPEVEMAESMERLSAERVRAERSMVRAELQLARRRAQASEHALEVLEKSVIPKLREAVKASEFAYASGTGSFQVLLEDALSLSMREEALLLARVERERRVMGVLRILGQPELVGRE